MPSPPAAGRRRRCPAQPVAQHPQRIRPLQRLDRRVLRVGHAGVDAGHARAAGPAALPAGDGLVVDPAVAADEQVVHRPLAGGRDPVGQDLGEGAEAHVGHPLADLDVAGAHGAGGAAATSVPAGAITLTGRMAPPLAGMVGSAADRRAKATADAVTASTALTLPGRCGSVPVKSKVTSSPATVTVTSIRPGAAGRASAPVESMTSSKVQAPSGRAASAARMRRSP